MAKKKRYEYHEYRDEYSDPVEKKQRRQRLRDTFNVTPPHKMRVTEWNLDEDELDDYIP